MTTSSIKEAKIGYFRYKIYFQPSDGEDHGSTCTDTKRIFVDTGKPVQCQRETLFHELCHACFDDCPSFKLEYNDVNDREEDIVRFISPRMMQVLNDNKWIRDFLFPKQAGA